METCVRCLKRGSYGHPSMAIDFTHPESPEERISRIFLGRPVEISSKEDWGYNCVAWAAGCSHVFWTHERGFGTYAFWPVGVPRGETLGHLVTLYESLGFTLCADGTVETQIDKIALFEQDGVWAHACKLCEDGRWWSKIDYFEDVKHTIEDAVAVYGTQPVFMKRAASSHENDAPASRSQCVCQVRT